MLEVVDLDVALVQHRFHSALGAYEWCFRPFRVAGQSLLLIGISCSYEHLIAPISCFVRLLQV